MAVRRAFWRLSSRTGQQALPGFLKDVASPAPKKAATAEQGFSDAQNNLGVCYDCGEGIEQDKTEAVKWYRKAAEQGNAGGQLNLGLCYEKGEGVKPDKTEAIKWLRKAAEQDITEEKAKVALKRLGAE